MFIFNGLRIVWNGIYIIFLPNFDQIKSPFWRPFWIFLITLSAILQNKYILYMLFFSKLKCYDLIHFYSEFGENRIKTVTLRHTNMKNPIWRVWRHRFRRFLKCMKMNPFGVFQRVFVKIVIRIGWMVLKWEAATNKGKRGSYRQTDRHTDTSPPEVIIFNS